MHGEDPSRVAGSDFAQPVVATRYRTTVVGAQGDHQQVEGEHVDNGSPYGWCAVARCQGPQKLFSASAGDRDEVEIQQAAHSRPAVFRTRRAGVDRPPSLPIFAWASVVPHDLPAGSVQ